MLNNPYTDRRGSIYAEHHEAVTARALASKPPKPAIAKRPILAGTIGGLVIVGLVVVPMLTSFSLVLVVVATLVDMALHRRGLL